MPYNVGGWMQSVVISDLGLGKSGGNLAGPTLVRLGGASAIGGPNTVSTPIVVDGFEFDAPSTTLKLLTMDDLADSHGEVILANGNIQRPYFGAPEAGNIQIVAGTQLRATRLKRQ